MKPVSIDITHIPFSRYGAYLAVTRDMDKDGIRTAKALTIQAVRRRFEEGPMFSLSFGAEEAEDFTCSAAPEALKVENEHGSAVIWLRDDDTLAVESRGLDLRLKMLHYGYGTACGENAFHLISATLGLHSLIAVEQGIPATDGPIRTYEDNSVRDHKTNLVVRCEDGKALFALSVHSREPRPISLPILREKETEAIRREWEAFLALLPDGDTAGDFERVTWFNLWSCFVRAEGNYPNDTMLMSKKMMSSTWSWDHCFNALAMAHLTDGAAAKRIAMDQFSAPFWQQTPMGVLPDMWNPDLETRWGTTKPPIHGWCFGLLMDRFRFDRDTLTEAYCRLERWTRWWTEHSDSDGDGIPDYPQGCDSGWDNSTLFDSGYFMETPDLPAFLVLQMKTLARIAEELKAYHPDFEGKAAYWNGEAEAMLARLIAHSWNGERFVAKRSGSHEYEDQPTSLLSLMPLVLGDLLPQEIRDKLTAVLERDFLTENGLATEMPDSPKYRSNGYWRGPIWAPSTYLIVDGLRRGGYGNLARTVAERYCAMSAERAKGNYENFDALTGRGLCAPGYTWSASVYMLLHWEYAC